MTRIWRRGESSEFRTTPHGIESTSDYQNSPIQYIIETGQWLDIMLIGTTDRYFPILTTLQAQGITHYVMAPLIFSNRTVNAMSWATDCPAARGHGIMICRAGGHGIVFVKEAANLTVGPIWEKGHGMV